METLRLKYVTFPKSGLHVISVSIAYNVLVPSVRLSLRANYLVEFKGHLEVNSGLISHNL